MKQLNRIIQKFPFYHRLRNWAVKRRQETKLIEWERNGRPVPPPHIVKQRALREHGSKYGLKILCETGTYRGDMVEAMMHDFDQIFSIELSQELFERAKSRFDGQDKVILIQGDSGVELKGVVDRIDQPALFWLDGHYSAGTTARGDLDTPIFEELRHVLDSPIRGNVIVIDDARCFGTDPGYPTIEALSDFVKSRRPESELAVAGDSIRITPKEQQQTAAA
ncbi:MAG: hypothetical protein P8J37_01050 [Fuerstiella sp.]|nr:hypothetical protein [Fuerstiella sp.]